MKMVNTVLPTLSVSTRWRLVQRIPALLFLFSCALAFDHSSKWKRDNDKRHRHQWPSGNQWLLRKSLRNLYKSVLTSFWDLIPASIVTKVRAGKLFRKSGCNILDCLSTNWVLFVCFVYRMWFSMFHHAVVKFRQLCMLSVHLNFPHQANGQQKDGSCEQIPTAVKFQRLNTPEFSLSESRSVRTHKQSLHNYQQLQSKLPSTVTKWFLCVF